MVRKQNDFYHYFFLVLLLLIGFLSFLIVRPFMNSILASMVIVYIFYPIFRKLNFKIKNRALCSFVMSFFIILLLVSPFVLLINTSASDFTYMFIRAKQKIVTGELIDVECEGKDTVLCKISHFIKELADDPEYSQYLRDMAVRLTNYAIDKTSNFIFSLPNMILSLVITFFVIYYLFKDGRLLVDKLKDLFPIKPQHKEHIYKIFKETTYAVIYGSLVIALLQGIAGGIGFWIFGIKSPIIWGVMTAIFALVPVVGTAMIWVPASLFLMLKGTTEGNPMLIWQGVGLLIYGALIISSIDNLLKPKLIGSKAGTHPVFVLLGVIGGMALFGFAGLLIGPVILAIFKAFLDIYQRELIKHN